MTQHILENDKLRLSLDATSGCLVEIGNKLTGETYPVSGDAFEVQGVGFQFGLQEAKVGSVEVWENTVEACYHHERMRIEVVYSLKDNQAFAEKQVILTPHGDCDLRRVVLGRPTFSGQGLELVCYKHPEFDLLEARHPGLKRPPDSEPSRTFFGRTPLGGLMVGVELAFDASALEGERVTLAITPNLRLKAGQRLALEPAYLGVYRRSNADERAHEWKPDEGLYLCRGDLEKASAERPKEREQREGVRPLPSESEAMVALTTAALGPRRQKELAAAACGWHSEMEHWEYSEGSAEADMRALDFLAECGIDWITDSHPWGGEREKMGQLGAGDVYVLGPLVRQVLEHARQRGIRVVQWPSMNNTHPWSPEGRPFRGDRPEWLRVPAHEWQERGAKQDHAWTAEFKGLRFNCLANRPFWEWITRANLQAMATGLYDGWVMDGDFWGSGAYYQTTVPVECDSTAHDHLPGDANYACQKALDAWKERILQHYPDTYMVVCRPAMDLGVWAQRNTDACFTLVESGTTTNLAGGNETRLASRVRVHYHFFPHTVDWPFLFPSFANPDRPSHPWSGEHLDYILLSALSCMPNLLMNLPARSGLPEAEKAEIRRWLDWGRANSAYLMVRKDLFDWPGAGRVDGSAHIIDDKGIVFLFNPNKETLEGAFELSAEEIGLQTTGAYEIWQEHPASDKRLHAQFGQVVRWEVPGESTVVLRLARTNESS